MKQEAVSGKLMLVIRKDMEVAGCPREITQRGRKARALEIFGIKNGLLYRKECPGSWETVGVSSKFWSQNTTQRLLDTWVRTKPLN